MQCLQEAMNVKKETPEKRFTSYLFIKLTKDNSELYVPRVHQRLTNRLPVLYVNNVNTGKYNHAVYKQFQRGNLVDTTL